LGGYKTLPYGMLAMTVEKHRALQSSELDIYLARLRGVSLKAYSLVFSLGSNVLLITFLHLLATY
jgi:hypothetical protein